MKRLALIANPMAGARSAREWAERARKSLWGYEIEAHFPASAAELKQIVSRLKKQDYLATLILGGDGTQNQALQAKWSSQQQDELAPLYPFPAGTANDLSSELGIRADFEQAQRLMDRNELARIDVITVNGVPFSTVAGIGAGAALTQAINDTRRKSRVFCGLMRTLKSEIYTAMTAKTVLTTRAFLHRVRIESDAYVGELEVAALFVCNQDRLGGSLKVGSHSSNSDGRFEVLVIPGKGPAALLQDLVVLKSGRTPEGAIRFQATWLSIASLQAREIPVFGDGEVLLQAERLRFEIHPRVFSVFSGGGVA